MSTPPSAATSHLPLLAREDLGSVPRGASPVFVAEGHTAIGGRFQSAETTILTDDAG
jgi:hypothetical protein